MTRVKFVFFFSLLSAALCQEFDPNCPEINGFYADAEQCDKYHHCVDQVRTEKLCPDGMAFAELNPALEKCDFIHAVECGNKTILQPAKPSRNCPRQNGYYEHEDPSICNEFFYCSGGTGSHIICPETLVFSLKTKTCVWPDEAARVGCSSENLLNFTCPKEAFEVAVAHPRYADPDDCQFFYVCIDGEVPRHNGCKFGEVFNSETKACDQPINVIDCKDYYKEFFDNYFTSVGHGAKIPSADILAAAIGSGFKVPNLPTRIRVDSGNTNQRRRRPTAQSQPAPVAQDVPKSRAPVDAAPSPAIDSVVQEAPATSIRRRPSAVDNTAVETPETSPGRRPPVRTRRPIAGGEGPTRRRPLRRRPIQRQTTTTTSTTTTTTTTPIPDEYYYYDYDYPADAPAAPSAVA